MPKPQPSFTAEFKHEAVQLTKTSDKPKAQIARELGISDSALYAWCRAAEAHGEEAFPGKGHQLPLEEEIHRRVSRMRAGSTGARHLKVRRCGWSTLAEKIGVTGVDVTKAPALPQSERKRGK